MNVNAGLPNINVKAAHIGEMHPKRPVMRCGWHGSLDLGSGSIAKFTVHGQFCPLGNVDNSHSITAITNND